MKKWYLIVIVCLSLLGGCAMQQSALIETANNKNAAPADNDSPADNNTVPSDNNSPDDNDDSPVDLTNANGLVQFRAVAGSYGDSFDMFYVTFFEEDSPGNCPRCKQEFSPKSTLTFKNVASGTYYVNFRWYATKRWVVENPNGNFLGGIEVRVGDGSWQRLSSADTVHVNGTWWNIKISVR